MEVERDGKWRLPSGSGSLAMVSSRRQRLNVSVWQARYDNTHLEEAEGEGIRGVAGRDRDMHIHTYITTHRPTDRKVEQKQMGYN